MGGLVSKLQVVDSGNHLWQAAANRPFDQVAMPPQTRATLSEMFFFSANPRIRRVIFIATPHRGSAWANRPVGKLGAALVRRAPEDSQMHQQLMMSNPGVFTDEIRERIPTSIDMLKPESAMLQAIGRLQINQATQTHSIVGLKHSLPLAETGDGVVSFSSATHSIDESLLAVRASHAMVHRECDTTIEVARILQNHLLRGRSPTRASNSGPAISFSPMHLERRE